MSWHQFCGDDLWHNPFPSGLPNVSVCFQHTILVWIPVAFFWLLLPLLHAQAARIGRRYASLPWSPHLILKMGCVTYTHYVRKKSGMVSSGILHVSAIFFAVCGGPQFYQNLRQGINQGSIELNSSFLSRLTLWWFNPVPWKGARKTLEPQNLFELNEGSKAEYLSNQWEKHWSRRMEDYRLRKKLYKESHGKEKEPSYPSVVGCLFRIFRWEFLTATALKTISDTLQFANPFFLQYVYST
ncbi:hypothetical protein COOONC_09593 [Cooperia oncophora]